VSSDEDLPLQKRLWLLGHVPSAVGGAPLAGTTDSGPNGPNHVVVDVAAAAMAMADKEAKGKKAVAKEAANKEVVKKAGRGGSRDKGGRRQEAGGGTSRGPIGLRPDAFFGGVRQESGDAKRLHTTRQTSLQGCLKTSVCRFSYIFLPSPCGQAHFSLDFSFSLFFFAQHTVLQYVTIIQDVWTSHCGGARGGSRQRAFGPRGRLGDGAGGGGDDGCHNHRGAFLAP
jgi:hypothetical protein